MGSLVREGNASAIEAILAHVVDADYTVRCAALLAAAQVTEYEHEHVVEAVFLRLGDTNWKVRHQALTILPLFGQGERKQRAVSLVQASLKDANSFVREASIKVLARLAHEGVTVDISAILECLEDEDSDVRCIA